MSQLILASASPRRHEILESLGYEFDIVVPEVDESISEFLTPQKNSMAIAEKKAFAVFREYPDKVVMAADTLVVHKGEILGKPKNREDSKRMLRMLSDETHEVYTSVCAIRGKRCLRFTEITFVTFHPLTEAIIDSYVESGETDDKAGAYAIQGLGGALVKCIEGDYFSVVGLPVSRTTRLLASLGVKGGLRVFDETI